MVISIQERDFATRPPVLRTARIGDLDALLALSLRGGSGLTNLPPDRATLSAKLIAGEAALRDPEIRAGGAAIILIVEHSGETVGTSCIFPRVGAEWPFCSYRLTRQASRSRAVERVKAQCLLNLVHDFDGEAEVGGLFIDPDRRGEAFGTLAARGRYMFIAAHREWFGARVIAELRGWQDAQGRSPVWEAIGRHFYAMDFSEADQTGALTGNQFIADLGPRYPLYVSLLPANAQAAIGRPHDDGRPAYEMLLAEGFKAGDYVDIFDGGPTVVAEIDAVRTIRMARVMSMTGTATGDIGTKALIAVGTGPDFRLSRGLVDAAGRVEEQLAAALGIAEGDIMLVIDL